MSLNLEKYQKYGSLDLTRLSKKLSVSTHPTVNEKICLNLIFIEDNMRKLNNSYKAIGTTLDNHRMRRDIKNMQKSTNDTITFTLNLIKKLDSIVKSSRAQKHLKIKSQKLISDFNLIQKKFMQLDKSLNVKIHKTHLTNIDENYNDSDACTSTEQQQQQEFLPIDPNFEIELMSEQEQNVKQIESDVYELSQMMNEISLLVNDQAESVNKIEEEVINTVEHVEEARVQLRKASNLQNKKRKCVVISVVCLTLFVIIFVVVILKIIK